MQTLDNGLKNPHPSRMDTVSDPNQNPLRRFLPVEKTPKLEIAVTGSVFSLGATMGTARDLADRGHRVTVLIFGFTTRFLSVWFDAAGFWVHRGGVYGKSQRSEPLFTLRTRAAKIEDELARIRDHRPVEYLINTAAAPAKPAGQTLPKDLATLGGIHICNLRESVQIGKVANASS
jgi:hypothetical protein